jgi:hypothetical protein
MATRPLRLCGIAARFCAGARGFRLQPAAAGKVSYEAVAVDHHRRLSARNHLNGWHYRCGQVEVPPRAAMYLSAVFMYSRGASRLRGFHMTTHYRTISLQCTTCGGTDFENAESEDAAAIVECRSCHRTTTREQLIEDNAEHIKIQKQELANEVIGDLTKDFEKKMRDAFRGNKFIKIK